MNRFLKAVQERIDRERDERMCVVRPQELPAYDAEAYERFHREQRKRARLEQVAVGVSKRKRKDWFRVAMDAAKAKDRTALAEAQDRLTQRELNKLSSWMAEHRLV